MAYTIPEEEKRSRAWQMWMRSDIRPLYEEIHDYLVDIIEGLDKLGLNFNTPENRRAIRLRKWLQEEDVQEYLTKSIYPPSNFLIEVLRFGGRREEWPLPTDPNDLRGLKKLNFHRKVLKDLQTWTKQVTALANSVDPPIKKIRKPARKIRETAQILMDIIGRDGVAIRKMLQTDPRFRIR